MTGRQVRILTASAWLALALLASGPACSQDLFGQSEALVKGEAFPSLTVFHPGSSGFIALRADIKHGWHINSDKPLDKFLIPTRFEVIPPEGIEAGEVFYPEPDIMKLEVSQGDMSLYHGTVVFGARLKIARDAAPGDYSIKCVLRYQGCNNLTCLEPSSLIVQTVIHVGTMQDTAEMVEPGVFDGAPFPTAGAAPEEVSGGGSSVSRMIQEKGMFLAFVLIFIMGLALNLTPCIYPIIPITISFFGGQAGGKVSRALLLSFVYVLGMSITYSILGMIAATTGSLFGSALQNPWVILFIAAVLIALATSMFGAWEIRMPTFLTRKTGTGKEGLPGALFMGLTVGIVAAPCIGPFVLGLLTYVGELGNPVLGFFMFFTLAWGMGTPLLVLGTASDSLAKLPQSGNWMIWVKKIFGFILLAMAVYFARFLLGPVVSASAQGVIALAAGVFLGWIDRVPGMGKGFAVLRKTVAVICIAAAVAAFASASGVMERISNKPGIEWQRYSEENFRDAADRGKPVIVEFSAQWCIPCHELEARTFNDSTVVALSRKIVTLKVDLTKQGPVEDKIKKDFGVKGVPTIIFYGSDGKEIEGSRITGYVPAEVLIEKMKIQTGAR